MITGTCIDPYVPGYQFTNHYDCAIAGYKLSGESLKTLAEDDVYFGKERINKEELAIRFECKKLTST